MNNLNDFHEEEHPWKVYGTAASKVLFIGTFPPAKKRWSYEFFYPNKTNFFWKILASSQDRTLSHFSGEEAIAERKSLLDGLSAAITDMGHTILRRGESSLDEHILPVRLMDIESILHRFPNINQVILTSSSGKNSALSWFTSFLKSKGYFFKYSRSNKAFNVVENLAGRIIRVVVVRSPSPRSACGIAFPLLVQQYREAIFKG